jgi:hypothetical protein
MALPVRRVVYSGPQSGLALSPESPEGIAMRESFSLFLRLQHFFFLPDRFRTAQIPAARTRVRMSSHPGFRKSMSSDGLLDGGRTNPAIDVDSVAQPD